MSHVEKLHALGRLALARQYDLDDATAQVYLEGLHHWSADVVTQACATLAIRPTGDFKTLYPTLGDIIAECRVVSGAHERQRLAEQYTDSSRRLAAAAEATSAKWSSPKDFSEWFRRSVQAARRDKA
jgi:hypothetical protein